MSIIALSTAIGGKGAIQDCAGSEHDVRRRPQGEIKQAFLPRGQTSQGYSTPPASASTFFGGGVRSQRGGARHRGCLRAAPLAGEVQRETFSHQLAQQAGPIELVISSNYMQYWPRTVDRSRASSENLYLMKLH
jgi:hypothetical protein